MLQGRGLVAQAAHPPSIRRTFLAGCYTNARHRRPSIARRRIPRYGHPGSRLMQTPANTQPFDLLAHVLAASLQAQPGPPLLPGPYPASIADLLYAVVTGDPSPMQLQSAETHFRDINRMEDGATALRELRIVTAQYGRHPTLAFAPNSLAVPLLTVEQAPGAPLSEADEVLRTAVAAVSRMQLRLISHQYPSPLAGTMANAHRQLIPGGWAVGDGAGAAALQGQQEAIAQAAATLGPPLQILSAAGAALDAGPPDFRGPIRSARQRVHSLRFEPYGDARMQMLSYTESQRTADRPLGGLVQYWIGQPDAELAARWTEIDDQLGRDGADVPHAGIQEIPAWLDVHAYPPPGRDARRGHAMAGPGSGTRPRRLARRSLPHLRRRHDHVQGQRFADMEPPEDAHAPGRCAGRPLRRQTRRTLPACARFPRDGKHCRPSGKAGSSPCTGKTSSGGMPASR